MDRITGFAWRPHTTAILLGGFALVLIAVVAAYMVDTFRPTTEVRAGSGVFQVWVADTDEERIQGLSGVSSMPPNGGLLMDFQADAMWGIWMKDMKIPLDIMWLNSDKQVIYIVKNVPPEQSTSVVMQPLSKARYVIELNAGTVDTAGIKTGQNVTFTLGDA